MIVEHVQVGEVLDLQRRTVVVEVEQEYEEIGIRSFGRGIFHKEPTTGAELGTKRVFRIEQGDLVISNVFAWEGAIAVATEAQKGKIGSHRFMTFIPKDERIDVRWAASFFLSEAGLELIRKASPGSAGRNRTLAIDRFESLKMPLPSIREQRHIAERILYLRAAAEQLQGASGRASRLIEALAVSAAARPDLSDEAKRRRGWQRTALHSVMTPAIDPVIVRAGESYSNLGIYSYGRGLFAKVDIDGSATSARTLYRVRTNQFIYSRLFAFEGAYSYVEPAFDGFLVSNEFPTFDTDPNQLDARWLANYLRSPRRWEELGGSSRGLGVRRQRVPTDAVLAYEVWLPPIEQQRAMVEMIDRIDRVHVRRSDVERRCAALVPAALNQAFTGLS